MYSVFLHGIMFCLGCLGEHVCVMLVTSVCCVGCIVVSKLAVVFGVCAVVFLLGGLERLVRSLMLTYMGVCCFVDGVGFCDISRLATLAKRMVMSSCLEARRSCSGVAPLVGFFSSLLTNLASGWL